MKEVDKINTQIAQLTPQRESVMPKEKSNALVKIKDDIQLYEFKTSDFKEELITRKKRDTVVATKKSANIKGVIKSIKISNMFEKKYDEFDAILRPVLQIWYQKRIQTSGKDLSGNNVFYQDVNSYLTHVHSVYDCIKQGINPLDVWSPLPNLEQNVIKHFETTFHKIESKITSIEISIQRQTAIVVIHSTHTIDECIFDLDIHISNEVDIWCSSMKHITDDFLKLYKVNFNQLKNSFEKNDLLEVLASA